MRDARLPNLTRKPNYGKEVPKQKKRFGTDLFDFRLNQFSERLENYRASAIFPVRQSTVKNSFELSTAKQAA